MASWENEGKESIFVIWEELLQKDQRINTKGKTEKEKKKYGGSINNEKMFNFRKNPSDANKTEITFYSIR